MNKVEIITEEEITLGFESKDGDNGIFFSNGELDASAYSYEISSVGSVSLDKQQTYAVYQAMKAYYKKMGME